jgi:hypothetical protein
VGLSASESALIIDYALERSTTMIVTIINPQEDITRVYLQDLGGWDDSPVKYGVRPTIV